MCVSVYLCTCVCRCVHVFSFVPKWWCEYWEVRLIRKLLKLTKKKELKWCVCLCVCLCASGFAVYEGLAKGKAGRKPSVREGRVFCFAQCCSSWLLWEVLFSEIHVRLVCRVVILGGSCYGDHYRWWKAVYRRQAKGECNFLVSCGRRVKQTYRARTVSSCFPAGAQRLTANGRVGKTAANKEYVLNQQQGRSVWHLFVIID